jgi:phosphate transport system protein
LTAPADPGSEIAALRAELAAQGERVGRALESAVAAFLAWDDAAAAAVAPLEDETDRAEVAIEERALRVLALHRPSAGDLRFVAATLRVNSALERLGDHASNLAAAVRGGPSVRPAEDPRRAAESAAAVGAACRTAVSALLAPDAGRPPGRGGPPQAAALAEAVLAEAAAAGHGDVRTALILVHAARELERIGRLLAEIADDAVFAATGEIVRHRGGGSP